MKFHTLWQIALFCHFFLMRKFKAATICTLLPLQENKKRKPILCVVNSAHISKSRAHNNLLHYFVSMF